MKSLMPLTKGKIATEWGYIKSVVLLLVYGIIEELLEEAIAYGITALAARALSLVAVVALTGIVKVSANSVTKGLIFIIKPVVKKYTYKQGNDKTTKIVSFFRRIFKMEENKKVDVKGFFVKLFAYLKRNVKTNTATITNLVSSLGAGALTSGGFIVGGVQVPQWSVYVIGALVTIVMFVLTQLGVKGKGSETQDEYDARKQVEADAKQAKAEAREAEKQAKQDLADLKKQLAEEARAAAEAENEAKQKVIEEERAAEEAKRVAERNKRVESIKAEYYEACNKGEFEGTLIDYINKL